MRRFAVVILLLSSFSLTAPARAADQAVLGKLLLVKNPSSADKRKVVVKAKEDSSAASIVGDPTANGATLVVDAIGGTTNSETYNLAAGTSVATGKPFGRAMRSKASSTRTRRARTARSKSPRSRRPVAASSRSRR